MDEHSVQRGQQWLTELLQKAGFSTQVSADASKLDSEGSYWLVIDESPFTAEQTDVLIGKGGSVLDAIQYLANTTLNLGQDEGTQTAYTIELAGYRVRRQAELQALADEAAQQVRETGQEFEMAALSSAERRQVHTYLKTFDDLETESRGREPDRRLVVRLVSDEN
ncbi:RNA-binding protein [Phormidium tenue FACHB-886]|nr:RNA-binding protein [Phormidium tenue FACHB-886]